MSRKLMLVHKENPYFICYFLTSICKETTHDLVSDDLTFEDNASIETICSGVLETMDSFDVEGIMDRFMVSPCNDPLEINDGTGDIRRDELGYGVVCLGKA